MEKNFKLITLLSTVSFIFPCTTTRIGGTKDVRLNSYKYFLELHNRVASFRNWPNSHLISPLRLANEGYFYIDDGSEQADDDSVMCHACFESIPGLTTVENITDVRWTHSSICPYVHDFRSMRNSRQSHQSGPEATRIRQETDTFDDINMQNEPLQVSNFQIAGLTASPSPASNSQDTQSTFSNTRDPSSLISNVNRTATTALGNRDEPSSEHTRRTTFENCEIPQDVIERLVNAGYFYNAETGAARCLHCDQQRHQLPGWRNMEDTFRMRFWMDRECSSIRQEQGPSDPAQLCLASMI